MIYFQYNILCLYHGNIFSFFSLSVLLKLLKHDKLIVMCGLFYENIKQNICFLTKKVVARFDKKKIGTPRREKSNDDPREESLLKTLQKSLSIRTERGPYHCQTKREPYKWGPSGASRPSINFALQRTLDRVGDGYKFLYVNFRLEGHPFQATSHLKNWS